MLVAMRSVGQSDVTNVIAKSLLKKNSTSSVSFGISIAWAVLMLICKLRNPIMDYRCWWWQIAVVVVMICFVLSQLLVMMMIAIISIHSGRRGLAVVNFNGISLVASLSANSSIPCSLVSQLIGSVTKYLIV
jgi:hypothetical protein